MSDESDRIERLMELIHKVDKELVGLATETWVGSKLDKQRELLFEHIGKLKTRFEELTNDDGPISKLRAEIATLKSDQKWAFRIVNAVWAVVQGWLIYKVTTGGAP